MAGVSDMENKHFIREWLIHNKDHFNKVLDIGAGVGTYALMGRYPHQHWTALEVFEPYVDMFNLEGKYNKVVVQDARYADYDKLGDFDLIIAADMLEHMKKEEAKDILNKILVHSKTVLVCIPVEHNDQHAGEEGNVYETHVDHWHADEMASFLGSRIVNEYVGDVCAYFIAEGDL